MPVYKSKHTYKLPKAYIAMHQDLQSPMQYVRAANNNTISIIDQDGQILEQFGSNSPNTKILPTNLTNQQIYDRTLSSSAIEELVQGMNVSVLYVGASYSGKQKLADGNKTQLPMVEYFVQRIMDAFKRRTISAEYRVRMSAIISEKVYDCFDGSKTITCKMKQDKWEGVQPMMAKTVVIGSPQDFGAQLAKAIKNKNRLVLQLKDIYATHLCFEIIQKNPSDPKQYIVSKLNVFEIPGVECLSNAHSVIKIKDTPASSRSLIGFSHLVMEMAKFQDCIIHYQSSQLTHMLKEIIGCNSTLYSFLNLKVSDYEGALSTLKFLRPLQNIEQFPLINDSLGFGTIKKYRHWYLHNGYHNENSDLQSQKKQLEQQMLRLQTEQDYKRLLQKYAQLKQKYSLALKQKSNAQLELIKCEQQKIQLGKSLLQLQIENTKLIQKLQNKDYDNNRKLLNAENMLAQRQMSYQQCLDKINELSESLNEALETKRDLEVQFIALKRNFILQQRQSKQLKQDNQNLGLDVINLSKQNERLKKGLFDDQVVGRGSRIKKDLEFQKYDEQKRINKSLEQTIAYLKSQIQRYKKQVIELQMAANGMDPRGNDQFGKDYRRIELQNQNMEFQNRHRLNLRKIQELQQKVGYLLEQNQQLEEQVRIMKLRDHEQTQQYREKIGKFAKNTNAEAVVRELKDNFSRKDTENLDKINSLKRDLSEKKKQIINLKSYARQLIALLEEWGPKGIDVPSIKKYQNMDLTAEKGTEIVEQLRVRNIRLQQQIRRMKDLTGSRFKESRVMQQTQRLKHSGLSNRGDDIIKLKKEKNQLLQQNRRLTVLLKDGNKMDLNILKKENDSLKRDIQNYKNSSSISPSTGDQKLKFYEKHLKALQKQRSQLLSRCVVAEEQLKNLLAKVANGKVKA